jgi:hypothetical protein
MKSRYHTRSWNARRRKPLTRPGSQLCKIMGC